MLHKRKIKGRTMKGGEEVGDIVLEEGDIGRTHSQFGICSSMTRIRMPPTQKQPA